MKLAANRFSRGFSLVEVTLALGVAGFCLVALFGLLPIGVNSNQTSVEQTVAASMAASIVADLRAAPAVPSSVANPTQPVSTQYNIPIPTGSTPQMYTLFLREDGSNAQSQPSPAPDVPGWNADLGQSPRYRVTLTFIPPTTAGQLSATTVRVLVTWPAAADPKASTLSDTKSYPTRFSGSFETISALDRT